MNTMLSLRRNAMNILQNIVCMPRWVIGIIALAGVLIWSLNYMQAVQQHNISRRIRSGFCIALESLVIISVIVYYAAK